MPPSQNNLEQRSVNSSILAAALASVLGSRPIKARRFLWCCGMNTADLLNNLNDELRYLQLELSGAEYIKKAGHLSDIGIFQGDFVVAVKKERHGQVVGINDGQPPHFVAPAEIVLNLLNRMQGVKVDQLLFSEGERERIMGFKPKAQRLRNRTEQGKILIRKLLAIEVLPVRLRQVRAEGEKIRDEYATLMRKNIESVEQLLQGIGTLSTLASGKKLWLEKLQMLQQDVTYTQNHQQELASSVAPVIAGKVTEIMTDVTQELQNLSALHEEMRGIPVAQDDAFELMKSENRKLVTDLKNARKAYLDKFQKLGMVINYSELAGLLDCIKTLRICLRKSAGQLWTQYVQGMPQGAGASDASVVLSKDSHDGANASDAPVVVSEDQREEKIRILSQQLKTQRLLLQGIKGGQDIAISTPLVISEFGMLDKAITDVTAFLQSNLSPSPEGGKPAASEKEVAKKEKRKSKVLIEGAKPLSDAAGAISGGSSALADSASASNNAPSALTTPEAVTVAVETAPSKSPTAARVEAVVAKFINLATSDKQHYRFSVEQRSFLCGYLQYLLSESSRQSSRPRKLKKVAFAELAIMLGVSTEWLQKSKAGKSLNAVFKPGV